MFKDIYGSASSNVATPGRPDSNTASTVCYQSGFASFSKVLYLQLDYNTRLELCQVACALGWAAAKSLARTSLCHSQRSDTCTPLGL